MKVAYILILTLIVGYSMATITKDMDIDHGHAREVIQNSKNDDKLVIHIMPHTHDDVGWLKTPDEYFTGARSDIQLAGVQYILDGIYDQLMKDPKKKFTYVEIAFFSKWWNEQDEDTKNNVRNLVKEGRLTFVNGGWSMSDEANVNYEDFINNMKAGHDFLQIELNFRPKIGWHIDPFGHHSATAAMFAEMGFDAWFFARADYQDKQKRLDEKSLEFLWRPLYDNLGNRTQIYTQLLYQHYHAPEGFCFSETCSDDPIVDDPELETYNVDKKCEELHDYLTHMAAHYRTNHLLIPFGQDFAYLNAQKYFKNLDKLMAHMNKKYSDMELIYSNPYDYIDAVYESGVKLPTKYDDMMPYADREHAYWSGYFTSRANFKGFVKEASYDFNTMSKIIALALTEVETDEEVKQIMKHYDAFNHQLGVVQHHDSVAGTAKQAVMDDYSLNLYKDLKIGRELFKDAAEIVNGFIKSDAIEFCESRNSTAIECPTKNFTTNPDLMSMSYHYFNTQGERHYTLEMVLPHSNFTIYASGSSIKPDIICLTKNDCRGYYTTLLFANVMKSGSIDRVSQDREIKPFEIDRKIFIGAYKVQFLTVNEEGQAEFRIENTYSNVNDTISIDLSYYTAFDDTSEPVSGAYLFRTKDENETPKLFNKIDLEQSRLQKGDYVSVFTFVGDQADIRVFFETASDFIRVESHLKGLPYTKEGMEVILRIRSKSIKNEGVFYTDSMGMEMQKRKLNHRSSWDLDVNEPISGNYYPVNTIIAVSDKDRTLEVIPDRAQGGSSLHDGEIELMIQRRLYVDDDRGLKEALNETDPKSPDGRGPPIITNHYFRLRGSDYDLSGNKSAQAKAASLNTPPITFYVDNERYDEPEIKNIDEPNDYPGLPDGVKILIFPETKNQIFIRLENVLDVNFGGEDITVDLETFLDNNGFIHYFETLEVEEVSLSGMFTMEEMKQRKAWMAEGDTQQPNVEQYYEQVDIKEIKLEPQRIRSFRIRIERKYKNISEGLNSLIK